MESNRKDCAATFALLLPVKVKLKVEATRGHKSKKRDKTSVFKGKMGADPCKVSILLEEWVQGSCGICRVEWYAEAGYIVLALQAVLPKPPAEFQPSHSFLPGH